MEIKSLPKVRGKYRENARINNWFNVGGKAEVLFQPKDVEDLSFFLKNKPNKSPITILGVGSNVIISDKGITGITIKLGQGFNTIQIKENILVAGCANLCSSVTKFAHDNSIAQLEFLSGIPGTIGGAIAMNAGAYGKETKDFLISVEVVKKSTGEINKISAKEIDFSYRNNSLSKDYIFTSACLKINQGTKKEIGEILEKIKKERGSTQPIKTKTGGSTFKNPDLGISNGKKAWQLIDEANCRGLTYGGAKVSELHCNFLQNTGDATASDIQNLGNLVQQRVYEKTGIKLEWEIKFIGKK